MEFKQRNWFESIKYQILEDGIKQSYRSLSNSFEQIIKFEEIGSETIKDSKRKKAWLLAGVVFLILTVAVMLASISAKNDFMEGLVFWPIVSGICFLIYFTAKVDRIFLIGKVNVFFLNKKSDLEKVDRFIKIVLDKRKCYLKEKYAYIEYELDPSTQIERLKWMLDEKVITTEEYERMKSELIGGKQALKTIDLSKKFFKDSNSWICKMSWKISLKESFQRQNRTYAKLKSEAV